MGTGWTLSAEITDAGGRAYGYTLDALNEDSVKDIFAQVEAEVGALDLVICNVGGNVKFALHDTTARVFRKVWEMACFAGFLAGREAARYMVPRSRGAIFLTGVPQQACAAPAVMQRSAQLRLGSGLWHSQWQKNWAHKTFMSRIW